MTEVKLICSACLTEACLAGILMCEKARTAGTVRRERRCGPLSACARNGHADRLPGEPLEEHAWLPDDRSGRPHGQPAQTAPRPVHLLDWLLGWVIANDRTWCGRGGATFKAPTTTNPAEATCKTCIRAYTAHENR